MLALSGLQSSIFKPCLILKIGQFTYKRWPHITSLQLDITTLLSQIFI